MSLKEKKQNGSMVSCNNFFLIKTICLHTVIWLQLFLSNTNNFHTIIWFQSHQRDKHLGSPHCKILGTILEMDKGRTLTNGLENKKKRCLRYYIREMTKTVCVQKEGALKIALMHRYDDPKNT